MAKPLILIVDDEPSVRFGIRDFLEAKGYLVAEAGGCSDAERAFSENTPDAVVLDYRLPDGDALGLLRRLKQLNGSVPVLILTAHGSIDLAVQSIQEGADQFLTKPVELESLLVILNRLLASGRDRRARLARDAGAARDEIDPFVGSSPAIRRLAAQVERILDTESPVLIQGPTGSGKTLLARWIHRHGARREESFVDLNCAGLTRDFLESELFGYARGAFTGSVSAKPGMLEIGHRGTVFLDEIGDLHPEVQPKLLKVLEDKRFRRLGEVRDRVVDVRLISATNRDLATEMQDGRFRRDLYFRVNTIPLHLPALAERPADIPLLAERLLAGLRRELARPRAVLSGEAHEALARHHWPGNLRELRNVLERAILLSQADRIEPGDLMFERGAESLGSGDAFASHLTLGQVERRYIERILTEEGGNVVRTARRLDIPRSTLYEKLRRFGLPSPRADG